MTEPRTTPYLTKFELCRVLGMRALQLSCTPVSDSDPMATAKRELLAGHNCYVVLRRLPDGTHETRPVSELRLTAQLRELCQVAE